MALKKEEKKAPMLTHKVIKLSSYYSKARELIGSENVADNGLALLYSENDVVAQVVVKGEIRFVVKI